jgi:hypothetical protein
VPFVEAEQDCCHGALFCIVAAGRLAPCLVLEAFDEFPSSAAAPVFVAEHLPGGGQQPAYAGRSCRPFFPGDPEDVRRQFLSA